MGKNNGNSWLKAITKAFRSPAKDSDDKRSCRRREEETEQEEEEKKRGKRRWINFRKAFHFETTIYHNAAKTENPFLASISCTNEVDLSKNNDKRLGNSVSEQKNESCSFLFRENNAALVIQSVFRGNLARRALMALKGVVMLQALIRGDNVRRLTQSLELRRVVNIRTLCNEKDPIKTIQIDTSKPYNSHELQHHSHHKPYLDPFIIPSPLHKKHSNIGFYSPKASLSSSKIKVRSSSPYLTEERNYHTAETPTLRSNYFHRMSISESPRPNYMAATASTAARIRAKSTPRQRPMSPCRDQTGSSKKLLSLPFLGGQNADDNVSCSSYKSLPQGKLDPRRGRENMISYG